MAYHFDHIHITAEDPRRSAEWWAETFGAMILPEVETGSMLFAPVSLDDVKITFSGPRPSATDALGEAAPIPHYGLEHLGLTVDNLEASLAVFRAQDLEVYERKQSPAYKIAFVAAPDGVCLELMEPLG